jgi:D-alanyl-D-alanine carboxypeptidase
LGLLVGLGALLFLFVSGSGSPPVAGSQGLAAPRARVHRPPQPTYAYRPAPAPDRVAFAVRLPLGSGLLFDVRTGAVLWGDQPDRTVPIASLTKMMTALVVVAHSNPTDRVLITPAATHFTGSGVGLLPLGKRVPELALLYGLLLPSGNDAAIALAQHVAGTREQFIALMNQRALQMGLRCSHFNSVSGIVDLNNHSCARDLAVLTHAMLRNHLLAKIIGSRSAILPFPIRGGKLYLYNNNPLLVTGYPGTDGVKTGYTDAAGQCLVATVRRGRRWLGMVLLHSADTGTQAENLFNAAFARLRS